MGGDEFAVLQREPADAGETRARVDRLNALLSAPFEIDGASVFISVSIGITLFPDDGDAMELLHRNADLAMYCAKTQGRNRCQFFDEFLNDELHRRSSLEQALRELDAASQFHIAYQPQVDMRSGCVTGVEALLRWNYPNGRLVGPDEFVPILEAFRHDRRGWRLGVTRELPAGDAMPAGRPAAVDGGGQRSRGPVPRR